MTHITGMTIHLALMRLESVIDNVERWERKKSWFHPGAKKLAEAWGEAAIAIHEELYSYANDIEVYEDTLQELNIPYNRKGAADFIREGVDGIMQRLDDV